MLWHLNLAGNVNVSLFSIQNQALKKKKYLIGQGRKIHEEH